MSGECSGLEGLGGGHVGLDHELLDQLVGIEPFGRDHALDHAVGVEDELALGDVQFQRLALAPALHQHAVGLPQGLSTGSRMAPVASSGRPSMAACACS
jgi:hypothetical protein